MLLLRPSRNHSRFLHVMGMSQWSQVVVVLSFTATAEKTGLGIDLLNVSHHPTKKGIFHLQQIFEGHGNNKIPRKRTSIPTPIIYPFHHHLYPLNPLVMWNKSPKIGTSIPTAKRNHCGIVKTLSIVRLLSFLPDLIFSNKRGGNCWRTNWICGHIKRSAIRLGFLQSNGNLETDDQPAMAGNFKGWT